MGAESRVSAGRMWLGWMGQPAGWRMPSVVNGGGGIIKIDGRLSLLGSARLMPRLIFQGPELQIDVGELAIWAMGADS